jgi:hypothetical protein
MARAGTATLDGLVVGYGTRDTINPEQALVHTLGRIRHLQVEIDALNYLQFATSTAPASVKKNLEIPTGAVIQSSQFIIKTGFNLLTSVNIGTKNSAGTTIVAAGLHSAVVLASINTAGQTDEGAGSQVNGTALASAAYISFDVTGSAPTAGHGILIVRYLEPMPSQTPPAVLVGVQ